MLPENYSPPLTPPRTGNPQMRAERQGTKEMHRKGDAGAGEPQGEGSEAARCASQADGGSLARSQLGGSSLQSPLCFVSVLSAPTGDEVSLRKMMVMAD